MTRFTQPIVLPVCREDGADPCDQEPCDGYEVLRRTFDGNEDLLFVQPVQLDAMEADFLEQPADVGFPYWIAQCDLYRITREQRGGASLSLF